MEPFTITAICITTLYGIWKGSQAYSKHSKRKKDKLALKGRSIEDARKDKEQAQKETDELKKKHEENEHKIKDLEKKAEDARNKSNDPKLSEEERIVWRNKAREYEDETNSLRGNNKSIFDKLKGLENRIRDNNKIISGTLSNLDDHHWIWDLVTLENILIVGGCYVAYKILKEKDK